MNQRASRISFHPEDNPRKPERSASGSPFLSQFTDLWRSYRHGIIGVCLVAGVCAGGYAATSVYQDRQAERVLLTASLKGDIAASQGIRRDVLQHLENQSLRSDLYRSGMEIAASLHGLVVNREKAVVLSTWETLLRQVACANHQHGSVGVGLYLSLKDLTLNTEERQVAYGASQRVIATKGDRDAIHRAQENLESCQ